MQPALDPQRPWDAEAKQKEPASAWETPHPHLRLLTVHLGMNRFICLCFDVLSVKQGNNRCHFSSDE